MASTDDRRTSQGAPAVGDGVVASFATAAAIALSLPLAMLLLPPGRFGPLLPSLLRGLPIASLRLVAYTALLVAVVTAPVAALATRRVRAPVVLLCGLAAIAVAYGLAGRAHALPTFALLRVLHGAGAGVVLAATAMAALDTARTSRWPWGLWAGVVAASLVAFAPVPFATAPAALLRPLTWLLVPAVAAALLLAVVDRRAAPAATWVAGGAPGTRALLPVVALTVGATALPVASSPFARWLIIEVAGGASPLAAVANVSSRALSAVAIAGVAAVGAAVAGAAAGARHRRLPAVGLVLAACGALASVPLGTSAAILVPGLLMLGAGAGLAFGAADAEPSAARLGVALFVAGLAAGTVVADVLANWSLRDLAGGPPTPLSPFVSSLKLWLGNVLAAGLLGLAAVVVFRRAGR